MSTVVKLPVRLKKKNEKLLQYVRNTCVSLPIMHTHRLNMRPSRQIGSDYFKITIDDTVYIGAKALLPKDLEKARKEIANYVAIKLVRKNDKCRSCGAKMKKRVIKSRCK